MITEILLAFKVNEANLIDRNLKTTAIKQKLLDMIIDERYFLIYLGMNALATSFCRNLIMLLKIQKEYFEILLPQLGIPF
jgi:hypothetical protein